MKKIILIISLIVILLQNSCSKIEEFKPLSLFSFPDSLYRIKSIELSNNYSDGVYTNSPIQYYYVYNETNKIVAISSDSTIDLDFVKNEPLTIKGYGENNEIFWDFYYYSYDSKYLKEFYKFNYKNNEVVNFIHIHEALFASISEFFSVKRLNNEIKIITDSVFQYGFQYNEKISRIIKLQNSMPIQIIDSSYHPAFGGRYFISNKQLIYDEFGNLKTISYENNFTSISVEDTKGSFGYKNGDMINPFLFQLKEIGFPYIFEDELFCSYKIIKNVESGVSNNHNFIQNILSIHSDYTNEIRLTYNYGDNSTSKIEMIIKLK